MTQRQHKGESDGKQHALCCYSKFSLGLKSGDLLFDNMEPFSGPNQPKSPQFMSSALKEVNPVLNKSYHTRSTGDNDESYTFHTFLAQPQGPPECVLFLLSYLLPFDSLFLKRKQKFIFLKPQEVLEPRAV